MAKVEPRVIEKGLSGLEGLADTRTVEIHSQAELGRCAPSPDAPACALNSVPPLSPIFSLTGPRNRATAAPKMFLE